MFGSQRSNAVGARRAAAMSLSLAAVLMSGHGFAQRGEVPGSSSSLQHEHRHFDARVALAAADAPPPHALQRLEIDALRARIPDLEASFDETTGATKTLWNRVGYLSDAADGRPVEIANAYVDASLARLGLLDTDAAEKELADVVYSAVTGATHIYYRQRIHGLGVYNAQLQVNVNRDGRIISINNSFVPGLDAAYNAIVPALGAADAVRSAADHLHVANPTVRVSSSERTRAQQDTQLRAENLSSRPVDAKLMLLPIRKGEVRLVWNFQVHTLDDEHAYDFTVDAESGKVWTRLDWVSSDSYKVYASPAESPNHTTPAPPADARTTVVNPQDAVASPFGWHDTNGAAGAEYTTTRGNNVHAYDDSASIDAPGFEPDCGASLDCVFAADLSQGPSTYKAAAIANMFYWTNLIHDVQYQYGFDEAAGNFQVNNYGRGGLGNDYVRAEAQDGSGVNNANMYVPPDGQRPRLQMYLWTHTNPQRDGDFDNGIIVHEYGHGISSRLVGGPSTTSCLSNAQQPGEGLSDWWALVYTARLSDTGPMRRGMGTYALAQPTTGNGIRGLPYTTDTAINHWTYSSIAGRSIPHGVGSVWAQGMWRVYWALVDAHGFSADLRNASGGAGNQRAMLYVNEGLKNTACNPTFTQVRDGILQAALDNYGGEDVCRMWDAFADFGLGTDAVSGGANSLTPIDGFNKPVSCGGTPPPAISIGDVSVREGHSGTTNAAFTVSLDRTPTREVRVNYATVDATAISSSTFSSSVPLSIPSSGKATVYPSTINVSGMTGTLLGVRVSIAAVTHTWPADLDVLLVGPSGQRVMLMSDVGANIPVDHIDLTFADGAPALGATELFSGTYAPTDFNAGETLVAPAPGGPYGTSLATFNAANPNGAWQLFVMDDEAGDVGTIEGWSLHLMTAADDYVGVAGQLAFSPGVAAKTIVVPIKGDTAVESTEAFRVVLSNPTGATIADAEGVGTIVDDDGVIVRPGAATLASPLRRIGLRPTYQWSAVDGATWYYVWVDDAAGARVRQWFTSAQAGCLTGVTCTATPAIDVTPGSVTWWVQTWNESGYGPWSASSSFSAGAERFVIGTTSGAGELQPWSSAPFGRQASLDLPWPAYNADRPELHPAVGDLNGDGVDEIVVGLGVGGQGYLAIFGGASQGFPLLTWIRVPWADYNARNGAVWPAVGDVDGDGRDEIVAGLGAGGEGFLAVFGDATSGYAFERWLRVSWPSYNTTQSGETHPAIVNVDGGAASEIVIGLGAGGAGWMEILNGASSLFAHRQWLRVAWGAYVSGAGETYPAGGDTDGDGYDEIVVGLGSGSQGWLEVFEDAVAGFVHKAWLQVSWSGYANEVGETHPAVGNLDGDAAMEVLIGLAAYPGLGGYFEIRDDSAASHASLGWRNVDKGSVYLTGGATFPAIGRLR